VIASNVAARLEALADPGGILVSRVVHDQVQDKLGFDFDDMGEQAVKNIARPVGIHRVHLTVLADLGEMLNDARTGKIKDQQDEWLAREIEAAFDDVFLEPPSRTKYWVSRYRAALENARKLAEPPHPIDVRLRRASSAWLERFATKAELPMIAAIMGEASKGIYSLRQIADIMFAYISHRLETASSAEIKQLADDATIGLLFRGGMYNRYLLVGWPHVPFQYDKPDFVATMKDRLARGRARKSYKSAHLTARLLFGNKEAPREIDELALSFIQTPMKEYNHAMNEFRVGYRESGGLYNHQERTDLARIVVNRFELVNDLSCIMHGDDRDRGQILPGRFGVYSEDVDEYRNYLAQE